MNAEDQRDDDEDDEDDENWLNELLHISDKTNQPEYPSLSDDEILGLIDKYFQDSPVSILDTLMNED